MDSKANAKKLEYLLRLDSADLAERQNEIMNTLGSRYAQHMETAILEDWGTHIHGSDVVRMVEKHLDPNLILGAFDDEIYDLFNMVAAYVNQAETV